MFRGAEACSLLIPGKPPPPEFQEVICLWASEVGLQVNFGSYVFTYHNIFKIIHDGAPSSGLLSTAVWLSDIVMHRHTLFLINMSVQVLIL